MTSDSRDKGRERCRMWTSEPLQGSSVVAGSQVSAKHGSKLGLFLEISLGGRGGGKVGY